MSIVAQFIRTGTTRLSRSTIWCRELALDTAEEIDSHITDCMDEYDISKSTIAVTSHPAAIVKEAVSDPPAHQDQQSCPLHRIHLAVKKVWEEPSVKATFAKHRDMVTWIHFSDSAEQKLQTFQKV